MDINEYDKKMMEVITTPEIARAVSYAINGLTEGQLFRNGNLLRKIIIEGESGYFDLPNAYHDKHIITGKNIRYEYSPINDISKNNREPYKWTYRTDSKAYKDAFHKLVSYLNELESLQDIIVLDAGVTTVRFLYNGDLKATYDIYQGSYPKLFIKAIKKLIPKIESTPMCLRG